MGRALLVFYQESPRAIFRKAFKALVSRQKVTQLEHICPKDVAVAIVQIAVVHDAPQTLDHIIQLAAIKAAPVWSGQAPRRP